MAVVKISGKDYPIRPTMWALVTFKREKGIPVERIPADGIEEVIYYAYLCVKSACMQDKIEFNISFDDFLQDVEGDPSLSLLEAKADDLKKKVNP